MINLRSKSLRNQLKYAFLCVTVLAVLVTGGLSYYISAGVLENKAMRLTQDSVDKSAQILDEKLNKLMLVMMTFMINQSFKDMLESVSAGDYGDYYKYLNSLDNVFSQARIAEPLIQSIYVSTPMGDFYPLSVNRNHNMTFQQTPMYLRVIKEKKNIWVEGHEDTLFTGKQRVISLILQPITDSTVFAVHDVYVIVNIRESGLQRLFASSHQGDSTQFLVNGDGQLVTAHSNKLVHEVVDSGQLREMIVGGNAGYASEKLDGRDYFFNYAAMGLNDWKIVSIQSKASVLEDLSYVKWMMLVIAVGCFLVATLISSFLIRYLLKPLQGLQKVMKRVESNDLTARFEMETGEELAQIGQRFNRMLEQIVSLIGEVKHAEQSKRTAEMKALSAQMDPHFLYNTLNTIYWKLKLNQVKESQHMVVSLSRLFQIGLNKGQEFTTLDKDLQHVEQYLELQKYCYENLFEYEIKVSDPSFREIEVPRVLLQPLVENSILHGFESMESGGRICIEVDKDPELESCLITVRDNGKGMTQEVAEALTLKNSEQGYAVRNLVSRLQLYYGNTAKLAIESELGVGLTVCIWIPCKGGIFDE